MVQYAERAQRRKPGYPGGRIQGLFRGTALDLAKLLQSVASCHLLGFFLGAPLATAQGLTGNTDIDTEDLLVIWALLVLN